MSETSLEVGGRQVITIRLDPNSLQGRDLAGQPALYLPLQLQLLPAGEKGDVQYTLLRLAGKMLSPRIGEFASFDVGPLALVPNPSPYYRHQEAMVLLDRQRVRRLEDARSGGDAHLQLMIASLMWYPAKQTFETVPSRGYLEIVVPRSQWAEKMLSAWGLSNTAVIEIEFRKSSAGENFRAAYGRVEEAERLFASGQYKQALTTLRLSFEALALSFGFEGQDRVKRCFEFLFASAHPEKKEKAREALTGIYRFLHLGPHEQANNAEANTQPVVTREDARFALTLAYAIFEYVTPKS